MPIRHDVIIIGAGHNGLVAAACLGRARRRVLVLGTAALWVVAPLAGAAGVLLLRLPLLQLTALALAQRATLFRSARSFPAEIG